jgi:hypothetical protein
MVYDTAHILTLVTLLQQQWSHFHITHLQLPFFSAAPGSIRMHVACSQLKRVVDLLSSLYPVRAVMVDGYVPLEIAAVLDNGLLLLDGLYISDGLQKCSDAVKDAIPSLPFTVGSTSAFQITTLMLTVPTMEAECNYSRLELTGLESLVLILDVTMVQHFLQTVVVPRLLHLHFALSVESVVEDHPYTELTGRVGDTYPATFLLSLVRAFYLKHRVESHISLDVRFTGFVLACTSDMEPYFVWLRRQCNTFAEAVSSYHQEWVADGWDEYLKDEWRREITMNR